MPDDPTPPPPWLSRTSVRGLYLLNQVPKGLLLVIIAAILVGSLLVEGILGGIGLIVLGLFFGWLLLISWPALAPVGRVIRVAVVGVIIGFGVQMLLT